MVILKKSIFSLLFLLMLVGTPGTTFAAFDGFIQLSHITLPMPGDASTNKNIELATIAVDGTILQPGESFSYNKIVGPRTANRGFQVSRSVGWVGDRYEMIPDIGGGVCRVSTAIHHAALKAGMKIIERHNHNLPVEYATPGNDAAVWYNTQDYKFVNTRPFPVKVTIEIRGNELHVMVEEQSLTEMKIEVDEKDIEMPTIPMLIDGHLLVPVKPLALGLGCTVQWDNPSHTLIVKKGSKLVEITYGKYQALVNKNFVSLTHPMVIYNSAAYIPARFLGDIYGHDIEWDEDNKTMKFTLTRKFF